jgi:hypothetical protein
MARLSADARDCRFEEWRRIPSPSINPQRATSVMIDAGGQARIAKAGPVLRGSLSIPADENSALTYVSEAAGSRQA